MSRTLSLLLPLLIIGTLLFFVLRESPEEEPLEGGLGESVETPADEPGPTTTPPEDAPLPTEVADVVDLDDVPRLLPPDVLLEDARDALAGSGGDDAIAKAHAAIAKRLRDSGLVGNSLERAIQRERDPLVRAFAFTALGPAATPVLSARLTRFLKSLANSRHPDIEKIGLLAAALASPSGTDTTLKTIGNLRTRIGGGAIAPELRRAIVKYIFATEPKSPELPALTDLVRASLKRDAELAWSMITTRQKWAPWIAGLGTKARLELRTAVLAIETLDADLRVFYGALD